MSTPFLSIVIPAYNEASRINDTLKEVVKYLSARQYDWEVLVADDGSTDDTARLVTEFASRQGNIHLLRLPHKGKGWAVKNGMLKATGEYRFMCDADLSMPFEQVERFLPPQVQGVDIAIGSREAPNSRRFGEPSHRHIMGLVYNRVVRTLSGCDLSDTQCGFKCLRGEVVPELFSKQVIDGFAFDVEILFLATKAGLRIDEIGIDWYYREQSKVRPVRDSLAMTWDLLQIRWRNARGVYNS